MGVIEHEVNSTTELVDFVLKLGQTDDGLRTLWHRGHRSENYSLVPSLVRKLTEEEQIFPMERRLITRFRQRSLPFWPAGYPQNVWEHLFAMQHFGIPTRMLDWSESLLVALYFAATPGTGPVVEDEETPAIWTLDPVKWNRSAAQFKDVEDAIEILTTDSDDLAAYTPSSSPSEDLVRRYKVPLAIFGTHNSARIVAQRGAFTVGGRSLEPMDSFVPADGETLWKIRLEYSRQEMIDDLQTLGFAESMIFPDLVGLSKEITASEGLL
ncbi:FRG domain-containing protein [Cryobacterium soli]|uniref:FRG domain-containing protein n=1 Tax=Cryobacterium soli TaxID=2220095 RepID=UPI000E729BAD|nr:FRG domain-containing protein [Cryobacterium soli]